MRLLRSLAPALAALLLAGAGFVHAAPQPPDPIRQDDRGPSKFVLQPQLEALSYYRSGEPIQLRFSLHNPSNQSVWVMRWLLPSDDMDANLFAVSRDGEPVAYHGPLVKRAPAAAEDWVEIKAGETFSVAFDPSSIYEMSGKGQYAVHYRVKALPIRRGAPRDAMDPTRALGLAAPLEADAEPHSKTAVASASAELFFEGLPSGAQSQPVEMPIVGGYSKCTTSQQGLLATAHDNAQLIAGLAENAVGTGTFSWWFGTNSASSVKPHYTAIKNAFANKSVTYDCGCKKRYYAYVYPNQPYKIYVCSVFWQAPMLGRDCKAGTLVHEMSHFTVVVGTNDYVYGATGAHNLALSDPAKAFMNADNHEYFAEDQKMQ
jgi:peptidyl-Lys metalloendopeptidase